MPPPPTLRRGYALGKAEDRQRLAIAGGLDRDVAIKLQVGAHARAVGHVLQHPVRVDVGEHRVERSSSRRAAFSRTDADPRRFHQPVADTGSGRHLLVRRRIVEQRVPCAGRRLQLEQCVDLRPEHAEKEGFDRFAYAAVLDEVKYPDRDPGIAAGPQRAREIVPAGESPAVEPQPRLRVRQVAGMHEKLPHRLVDKCLPAGGAPVEGEEQTGHEQRVVPQFVVVDLVGDVVLKAAFRRARHVAQQPIRPFAQRLRPARIARFAPQ